VQVLRAAGHFAVRAGEPNQYEVNVGVRGRGRLVSEAGECDIGPGTVVHVQAGEHHRFTEVTEDLSAVVAFAPAERSRE
jgi:mannose-6-phosphate isomerase-like protein (cupin superfamily)